MKIFLILVFLTLNTGFVMAENFKIKVTNIDVSRGGNLIVFIFVEDGYPKQHDKAVNFKTIKVLNSEEEIEISSNLDELAIKVLHDENGDGKVTKNWTGIIPSDGLGFSNKQKITITGPPKYKTSKLLKSSYLKGVNIKLQYF